MQDEFERFRRAIQPGEEARGTGKTTRAILKAAAEVLIGDGRVIMLVPNGAERRRVTRMFADVFRLLLDSMNPHQVHAQDGLIKLTLDNDGGRTRTIEIRTSAADSSDRLDRGKPAATRFYDLQ